MTNQVLLETINEQYNTMSAFGLAIGWVPQKVHRMVHEGYIPKLGEAVEMSRALNVTLDELASILQVGNPRRKP